MIFEIRKVSFLFRSSPVRATPSSISSCVFFHLTSRSVDNHMFREMFQCAYTYIMIHGSDEELNNKIHMLDRL
ncbi:hypothetical protein H5410_028398 [Solanum commersonii]|uniref:Uncharacterized protein n=1 Tax=Solanum commersonii TaxID=4109 RepID=A0A9J5Z2K4_SOLCO|nr:hypothetical protein H5410_028398 [Solanum commersonii]